MLLLETLGMKSVEYDHAASHLGRCQGLVGLIRSVPALRRKRVCLIPNTTLAKYDITHQQIIENTDPDKLKDAIHDTASSAYVHAQHCQTILKSCDKNIKLGFLPLTAVKLFLARLQKYDFDINNGRTMQRSPLLPFYLYRSYYFSTF